MTLWRIVWSESQRVSRSVMSNSLWPHGLYLTGSLVHGILQARILEWVAIPFFRGSSHPRDKTQVSCVAGRLFTIWVTREALYTLDLVRTHIYPLTPPLAKRVASWAKMSSRFQQVSPLGALAKPWERKQELFSIGPSRNVIKLQHMKLVKAYMEDAATEVPGIGNGTEWS